MQEFRLLLGERMHRSGRQEKHPEGTYYEDDYEEYPVPEEMYPFSRTEIWVGKAVKSNRAEKRAERLSNFRNRNKHKIFGPEAYSVKRLEEGIVRDKYIVYVRMLIARPEKPGEDWETLLEKERRGN